MILRSVPESGIEGFLTNKRNADLIKKLERQYFLVSAEYGDSHDGINIVNREYRDHEISKEEYTKILNSIIEDQNRCKKEMERLKDMIKILKNCS